MNEKQQTISKSVSVTGVGLHTGVVATMTFVPAPANHGYKFQRVDLPGQPIVDADVDNVVDLSRGTTIEQNGARINTVEHTLAALVGLQIDNVLIQLDGPEPPIMDGSSIKFVDALTGAGIEEQNAYRNYFEIPEFIHYKNKENKTEMVALPLSDYRLTVMVDYNSKVISSQHASLNDITLFKDDIAQCRTFVFLHELEALYKQNLIKGGDLTNAIVIVDRDVEDGELDHLSQLLNKPKVSVDESNGILNNVDLHFPNEMARHKLLDLIGDLALIGRPIKAQILAARPGHAANVALAKKIKKLIKSAKDDIPQYDPNKAPVFDINQIGQLLAHRYPFQMIDKIIALDEKSVVGVKNVTINEQYFIGHFPGNPVMPGVLQLEAMAQTGGILVLSSVPDPDNYWPYLIGIDACRFRRNVFPGDTVIFKCEFTSPMKRGIVKMSGRGYVSGQLVCEADMIASLVKKKMTQSLSYIHPGAKIAQNVEIEPFAMIHDDVEIGEGSWIGSHAVINSGARIGKNCRIFPGAVISATPQDLKYNNEYTFTIIGDNTTVREYATISRGTEEHWKTVVGSDCMIMAYAHVAHDCRVGNSCIIGNNVQMAGHVHVGDWAIISALSAVHQFVKIGAHAFVSGATLVRKDVPPYTKAAREPISYAGINSVGLRRRGFSNEKIIEIQNVYRYIYMKGLNNAEALHQIELGLPPSDERDTIINFVRSSERGIMRSPFQTHASPEGDGHS